MRTAKDGRELPPWQDEIDPHAWHVCGPQCANERNQVMNANAQKFLVEYTEQLARECLTKPLEYAWPAEQAPEIAAKMVASMTRGGANVGTNPIKRTCRKLGIKPTATAIKAFLNGVAP